MTNGHPMKAPRIESVRIMPTGGHPLVYGEWLHAPGKPTVLIYGHFDTQPVDPLALWDSPPFDPVIKEGRIYARGSTDDKGNMFIPIIVAEAMLKTSGRLPVNLKFLFEGEEEIASPPAAELYCEQQHSPNEFFRLSGYERGQKAYGMLLDRLAK